MNHGSLFSGIGGFDLAADWMEWKNSFHCEIDSWNQNLLRQRFPNSVQYGDITQTDFTIWRGRIDVLTGGFPCQDASQSNGNESRETGLQGARTGLYWHMLRAIKEIQPRFVVAENVSNIVKINGGWDFFQILESLWKIGYDAEWHVITASQFGAPHRRERCYIIAYPIGFRSQGQGQLFDPIHSAEDSNRKASWPKHLFHGKSVPHLFEHNDGLSRGLGLQWNTSASHALGNAVVPQIPFEIFKAIQNSLI